MYFHFFTVRQNKHFGLLATEKPLVNPMHILLHSVSKKKNKQKEVTRFSIKKKNSLFSPHTKNTLTGNQKAVVHRCCSQSSVPLGLFFKTQAKRK